MKLKINITREVLEKTRFCGTVQFHQSNKKISEHCAIAYAVREIMPSAKVIEWKIYPFGNIFDNNTGILHHQNSFISKFDKSTPEERLLIPPFSFEIEVPEAVIERINIDEVKQILKTSKTLELVRKTRI